MPGISTDLLNAGYMPSPRGREVALSKKLIYFMWAVPLLTAATAGSTVGSQLLYTSVLS
jgi:hypothetical protein